MSHFWTSPRRGHSDELDSTTLPVLDALRSLPLPEEVDHERPAVAQITAVIAAAGPPFPAGRFVVRHRSRLSLTIALATGALALTSGLAFAGQLPGAAQDTAHTILAKLGVSVPGPSSHAGTHPGVRGGSTNPPVADQGTSATPPTGAAKGTDKGKGKTISALAHTTTATGRDKGAAISTAASGGKSHAGNPPGQSGSANQHGGSTSGTASGGTSHAGDPPGQATHSSKPPTSHSGQGASRSGTASGGHSRAGSKAH